MDVDIEERNSTIIISLKGAFTIKSVDSVEDIWRKQIVKEPGMIAFNLCELNLIDSSAIGTLVKFTNSAMNKKIDLILYGLSDEIHTIIKSARLANFFTIKSEKQFEDENLIDI